MSIAVTVFRPIQGCIKFFPPPSPPRGKESKREEEGKREGKGERKEES